jgi:hypothetical protein
MTTGSTWTDDLPSAAMEKVARSVTPSSFATALWRRRRVHAAYQGTKFLPGEAYERDLLDALNSYLPALRALGAETPAYVYFSLLGIKGYRMGVSSQRFFDADTFVADRDVLDFPEITITDWACDIDRVMHPLFDVVSNAFGLTRSFNYDEQGNWVGQR